MEQHGPDRGGREPAGAVGELDRAVEREQHVDPGVLAQGELHPDDSDDHQDPLQVVGQDGADRQAERDRDHRDQRAGGEQGPLGDGRGDQGHAHRADPGEDCPHAQQEDESPHHQLRGAVAGEHQPGLHGPRRQHREERR
ncbi:MAG TPA: hypothetical protein DEG26_03105 [Chloroflexi bacterium]|nr:hypothetical protein [Chloroflexota bacterium]